MPANPTPALEVSRCPRHGYYAVIIDTDGIGGHRITPSKCCGRWDAVKVWKLSADDWQELSDRAKKAAEMRRQSDAR